ncbi:MAG: flavodoxin domain-containing protein [Verrucomicrobiota bacterium]
MNSPIQQPNLVPCLPENAPFTPEQRAYLNGFLAGLFSREPAPQTNSVPVSAAPLLTLSILFASQTGNAENLAKRIAKEAGKRGFAPTVHDMSKYPIEQFASESRVLIIASTYGDGEPPDNTRPFWERLCGYDTPKLLQMKFSVCALGDTNYPKFCAFGKDLDKKLLAFGATCVHSRANCDVDFEESFAKWQSEVLSAITSAEVGSTGHWPVPSGDPPPGTEKTQEFFRGSVSSSVVAPIPSGRWPDGTGVSPVLPTIFSRNLPVSASLLTNRKLTRDGSEKTRAILKFPSKVQI